MLYDKRWGEKVETTPERQALLDAADYIEEHGWCQRQMEDGMKVCAMRALMVVAPLSVAVISEVMLRRHIGAKWGIPAWNDAPERTKEEVVEAMRVAGRSA